MIDRWNLSDEEKARFAIQGTHYDYFCSLLLVQEDLKDR